MEDAAQCHPKPSNPIFDLNGAFPSSSSHSHAAFPTFQAGSSSARCLSRPRMVKHRKRHVASATEKLKGPIMAGGKPPKHDDEGLPYFSGPNSGWAGFRFGQCGSEKNDSFSHKDGSFQPTSGSHNSFAFGVGGDKDFGFSFVKGRAPLRGAGPRSARRWVRGCDRRSTTENMKNLSFGEKIDARLGEEMKKLNIQNHDSEAGLHKLEESRLTSIDNHMCSSFTAPDGFISGSNHNVPEGHDGFDGRTGVTGQSLKDDKENLKKNVSVFGSIWTKNTPSSWNRQVNLDECSVKAPDDTRIPAAASDKSYGVEVNNGNVPPNANRKNAHLLSNRGDWFGKNVKKEETTMNFEGTGKIFSERRTFTSGDQTRQGSDSCKFMFQAVKQDSNVGAGSSHSVKLNDVMINGPTDGLPHSSSSNSGRDTTFGSLPKADAPHFVFQIPEIHACKENLFSAMRQSLAFDKNNGASKDARQRKRVQKLRRPSAAHRKANNVFTVPKRADLNDISDAASSPMDFSPLHDIRPLQSSKDGVIELEDSTFDAVLHTSADKLPSKNILEEFEFYKHASSEKSSASQSCTFDRAYDQGHKKTESIPDNVCTDQDSARLTENVDSFCCNPVLEKNGMSPPFSFFSRMDDCNLSNFRFATSSSAGVLLSGSKRLQKKKRQMKVRNGLPNGGVNQKFNLASLSMKLSPHESTPMKLDQLQNEAPNEVPVTINSESKMEQESEAHETPKVVEEAASSVARKTCEKWRLRGNKAYEAGNLYKAEKYYTRGVHCLSPDECSGSCTQALMLCYSNRAAARMSLGRIREALKDCMMAVSIDPSFSRAQIRAANCHLVLGETEEASKIYRSFFQSGANAKIDPKLLKEASDGLLMSQQVEDYVQHSSELLKLKACNDVKNALEMVSKALSMSPHSEKLIRMKAEALLKLSCYEELIKLCESTLESAEQNYSQIETLKLCKNDIYGNAWTSSKLWRLSLISKSYFYLGKLDEAIGLIKKHDVASLVTESCNNGLESLASFSNIIEELLRMKVAGNEAFQSGRYLEAVEHYTTSLSYNVESRPFAAVCFCNRAAGYQALGQLIDAIADCNLAIALNTKYCKAISRRATLHEMIRNYGQANIDMRMLISLLERHVDDLSGSSGKGADTSNNLRQARSRLATIEEELRKGIPLDLYKILGLESSSSAADIKKAYRKAALKHHPDKAAQLLVRTENADDILWNDLADEVRRDATSLFKMVGEAYAVLSDPIKRNDYDAEEMARASYKENSWHNANGGHCESGGFRNRSKEFSKSYGRTYESQSRSYRSRW